MEKNKDEELIVIREGYSFNINNNDNVDDLNNDNERFEIEEAGINRGKEREVSKVKKRKVIQKQKRKQK